MTTEIRFFALKSKKEKLNIFSAEEFYVCTDQTDIMGLLPFLLVFAVPIRAGEVVLAR